MAFFGSWLSCYIERLGVARAFEGAVDV